MKMPKPTNQELAERVRRNEQEHRERQVEANAELGFPLRTEDRSKGFPYMVVDFTPVELADGETVYNAEVRWRGLTAEQARALRAALKGQA